MLTLLIVFLLLYAVMALLVTAWSMWFQSRIYTQTAEGLEWRGPAAAGVILFPVLVWLLMARGSPDIYRPLWESTTRETKPHVRKLFAPDEEGKLQPYVLVPGARPQYHLNGRATSPVLPSRPRWVVIEENGQQVKFEPERDEKGKFRIRKVKAFATETEEPLRYLDDKGRIMLESGLGQLTVYKTGAFMGNLLLNFLLLAACFVGLWVLARFQWSHALGQAVVLWLLLLLCVLPPALSWVETAAKAAGAA